MEILMLEAVAIVRRSDTVVAAPAKLYQKIGHFTDVSVVLEPALKGCSPTLEFPEIAEVPLATLAQ